MSVSNFNKRDLAALSSIAALADSLTQSGAISEQERAALLDAAWNDTARNSATRQARNQAISFTNDARHVQETVMNLKSIFNAIHKNHAVIEAQIEKFSTLSTKCQPSQNTDGLETVASLLQVAMCGHFQNAQESIRAMEEVESGIRACDETAIDGCGSIIEGEAAVIESSENQNENR